MKAAEVAEAYGRAAAGYRQALSQVEGVRPRVTAESPAATELSVLTVRLGAQHDSLVALATRAQLPAPWLEGVTPAGFTTVEQMLAGARAALDGADEHLAAVQQHVCPPLLPSAAPTARAALVFGAWSLAAVVVQCGLLVLTDGTNAGAAVVSLCGMPLVAVGGSLVTLLAAGQPKVGARIAYPIKAGVVLCLLGMPLAWILLLAGLAVLRA